MFAFRLYNNKIYWIISTVRETYFPLATEAKYKGGGNFPTMD